MIVTELSPRSLDTIDIDADRDAARAWIAARYGSAEAETVRLNMITSLTGSAALVPAPSSGSVAVRQRGVCRRRAVQPAR